MLEIKDIQKKFGTSIAVNKVCLTIREGEFFSLLGPSGCGKTTLLRMIGGFELPDSGELILDGKNIESLPPHKRHFNMVFQRYALFPHLSVRENVAFGLKMKKVALSEIQTRVAEALELVKMSPFADRSTTTLSGGQQQRVALARAVVNRPRVLLLDEPLSALDLKLRQQMQVELLTLQRSLKISFIFVTHDQDEALTLSDRIAVMNGGNIEQIGTPQEIYEYPRTSFVADFIGSVNAISGQVLEVGPDKIALNVSSRRPLSVRPSKDGLRSLPTPAVGQSMKLLVRPEKLRLLKSAPNHEHNSLEVIVREVMYKGPITQYLVQPKSADLQPLTVVIPNTAVTTIKGANLGDQMHLAWAPEDCLLVDGGA